ncbi:hypothetical protein BD414DRAFT_463470, partial [Trametes punicea]
MLTRYLPVMRRPDLGSLCSDLFLSLAAVKRIRIEHFHLYFPSLLLVRTALHITSIPKKQIHVRHDICARTAHSIFIGCNSAASCKSSQLEIVVSRHHEGGTSRKNAIGNSRIAQPTKSARPTSRLPPRTGHVASSCLAGLYRSPTVEVAIGSLSPSGRARAAPSHVARCARGRRRGWFAVSERGAVDAALAATAAPWCWEVSSRP